jgi:hypothetical protein
MHWTRIFAAALALASAPMALADMRAVPPPPGVLPSELGALAALQRRHSSIVRRAERMCAHQYGWYGGAQFRACVVGSVENAVTLSQDPQLQAYHRSLPFPIRYQWRSAGAPAPWAIR